MTCEERLLKTIRKQKVDRIPICFHFADKKTEKMFIHKLQMGEDKFKRLVDSDIKRIYTMDDLQMYISDEQLVNHALEKGFAEKRSEENILYDRWGVGWTLDKFGQKPVNSPLEKIESILDFVPPELEKEGQFYSLEKNLKKYRQDGYAVIVPQFY